MERTLSIVKPNAVKQNMTGKIIAHFEDAGLRVVALRRLWLTKNEALRFYEVHKERAFYDELCEFMCSGPIVAQVLEGPDAVKRNRDLMGATNPANAEEGTIRKLYGESVQANSVHGSDSPENAAQEIRFFFSDTEVISE